MKKILLILLMVSVFVGVFAEDTSQINLYKNSVSEWKPTGYIDLQQKYYGTTEGQKKNIWNEDNDYMRTQLAVKIQMTQKQSIYFRTRFFQGAHKESKYMTSAEEQFRVKYYYEHGTLNNTQIDILSTIRYDKYGTGRGLQQFRYMLELDFAKYIFNNEYMKTTRFVVAPSIAYNWSDSIKSNIDVNGVMSSVKGPGSTTTVGIYFNWVTDLPYGFGTDLEIDTMNLKFGSSKGIFTEAISSSAKLYKAYSKKFTFPVSLLLTHTWNLWSNDRYNLEWYAEGGLDQYIFSNRKSYYGATTPSKEAYILKIEPIVTLTYKATNFVNVYGIIGAEYSNRMNINKKDASHWRWQPYIGIGIRSTF